MAGWTNLPEILRREFEQARQEGKDPQALERLQRRCDESQGDNCALEALQREIVALPVSPGFPFEEPDDLVQIRLKRAGRRTFRVPAVDEHLADQLHGAWLGRSAGCALGKPIELIGLAPPACTRQRTWRDIKRYLTAISPAEWPLRDFVPFHSPAESELPRMICPASARENIAYMETDDDIRYTVLGQIILQQHGRTFTTEDVAMAWIHRLPYRCVCTAETQAYRNLVDRYDFHEGSGWQLGPLPVDWSWVETHLNPYREWIGAQIRVDSYAYAAPGEPELAAEFAWRDARLSHVKNGVYGAMLCAAMISAAFSTTDAHEIVAAGLGEIPSTSRLHRELSEVVALCARYQNDFAHHEAVFDGVCDLLGHYSTTHTNNNAAVCVAALLLSGGDYHRGITAAVMGGFDTDCNGATVGSILGAAHGASRLPSHWTSRLNDTLNSEIAGYHPIAISECARRSLEIVRKIRSA